MYVYFGLDSSKDWALESSLEHAKLLGIYPSTRGRPPKNHEDLKYGNFEFSCGIVDLLEGVKMSNPGELKSFISKGKLPIIPADHAKVSAEAGMLMIGAVVLDVLETRAAPDASAAKQVDAIKPALQDALAKLVTAFNLEAMNTVTNILHANEKLINHMLGEHGWWHKTSSEHTPASPAAPTDSGEKVKDTDADGDDTPPVESIRMATATENFGFGRMSGGGAATATKDPATKLKVHSEPEARDDAAVNGVFLPRPDETYVIDEQIARLFKILQISRQNCPQNIRLVGPHGCGKTELAIQFAARLGLPLLIMDCANLREARDWFGYKSAREGTVYWHESQFVKAVSAGNHVIMLDELNRANPNLLNTLMPLLDARRFTYLEEKGDKICVGPGTVFFASMNEGAGYTGTSALDRAIRDRFPRVVELTYLNETDEINLLIKRVGVAPDIATRLVQMAQKIRQDATGLSASLTESLSTRQLIAAAHDFAIGGVETLTFTIINHFSADGDDDSERIRVQNIIQGKFGDMLAAAADKEAKSSKKGA